MKNIIQLTPWIIILILLAYINQCTHSGSQKPEIVYKDSIQIRDSISKPVFIQGPVIEKPVPYQVIIYDTLTQDTTLNEHLSFLDWMAIKKFALSVNDSNANYTVYMQLQYNSIKDWYYTGEIYERWKIKEVTKYEIPKPKNSIYAGLLISANKDKYLGISPALLFQTKKHTQFILGYDIINKNISTGVLIKIGKR